MTLTSSERSPDPAPVDEPATALTDRPKDKRAVGSDLRMRELLDWSLRRERHLEAVCLVHRDHGDPALAVCALASHSRVGQVTDERVPVAQLPVFLGQWLAELGAPTALVVDLDDGFDGASGPWYPHAEVSLVATPALTVLVFPEQRESRECAGRVADAVAAAMAWNRTIESVSALCGGRRVAVAIGPATAYDAGPPTRVVPLKDASRLGPFVCGSKAFNLSRAAAQGLPVVDGVVVSGLEYLQWRAGRDCSQLWREVGTLPSALPRSGAEAGAAAAAQGLRFAVRSSASDEDGEVASNAGTYQSCLDVDLGGIPAAIEQVWDSMPFSEALSAHDIACMAVLIQPMQRGPIGVLLTDGSSLGFPGRAIVEYHDDPDGITAGREVGKRRLFDPSDLELDDDAAQLVRMLRQFDTGRGVDAEIALGPPLRLLQWRPIATGTGSWPDEIAIIRPTDFAALRRVSSADGKELARAWMSKKIHLHAFAERHNIPMASMFFMRYTRRILSGYSDQQLRDLAPGQLLTLSYNSRDQKFVASNRDIFASMLREHAKAYADNDEILLRVYESVTAEWGCVATLLGDQSLYLEHGPGAPYELGDRVAVSTVTMDRAGKVLSETRARNPVRWVMGDFSSPSEVWKRVENEADQWSFAADDLATIREFTAFLGQHYPNARSEWEWRDGVLIFVDLSWEEGQEPLDVNDLRMLSQGAGVGAAWHPELGQFRELSKRFDFGARSVESLRASREYFARRHASLPNGERGLICLAEWPIRELSVLFPHVSGFVFRQGSYLCHLGLLLREAGVPAVINEDAYDAATEGVMIEIFGNGVVDVGGRVFAGSVGAPAAPGANPE